MASEHHEVTALRPAGNGRSWRGGPKGQRKGLEPAAVWTSVTAVQLWSPRAGAWGRPTPVPDVSFLPHPYPVRPWAAGTATAVCPCHPSDSTLDPFLPASHSSNFPYQILVSPTHSPAFWLLSFSCLITGSCGCSSGTSSPKSGFFSVPTASFLTQANIHSRLEGHISQQYSALPPIFHIAEGSS